MTNETFFINQEGNRISSENISSHIGLAYLIIQKDKGLEKEFHESGKENPEVFLLGNKGYMTASELTKTVVFDSKLISEKQMDWLRYYHEEGYRFHDVAREKEELER